MRLSGRIAAAIEIIDGLNERARPVSLALKDWGQANRFAGSKDRAAIGNLVYDVMRKRASHQFSMQSENGRALVLSAIVRDWGIELEELEAAFGSDNFAPEEISPEEKKLLLAKNPLKNAPEHIQANIPEWLIASFEKSFGKNWLEQAQAQSMRPPLDMRVNNLKSSPEKVQKSLERFSPQAMEIAIMGLRILPGEKAERIANISADEAYKKGWVEIQDQGSQIVSALSNAKPGEQVLDFCAGGGGKTLALAAIMENKGQIFAHDSDRNRLAPIFDRLKRAGIRNVQVRSPQEGALDNLVGRMDKVVIDAPCTGTGTWRRHPDSRWRLSPAQLEKRIEEQAQILDEAKKFLRPGGELIYITCSILPEENIKQIESFITKNKEFDSIDMEKRWKDIYPKSSQQPIFDRRGATLSPLSTDTDGFYISILALNN
ncbi:MAG: RsmB/NOP family class I SAM-dependent RNA methyltransferase [Devosiaceae bacterium]|nr:RsmB/NOP family class I SAM-dependent RNA methyltransferase [Devosiaceae bacterium]